MSKQALQMIVVCATLAVTLSAAADDSNRSRCVSIENDVERLACYDRSNDRTVDEVAGRELPAATAEEVPEIGDDYGAEQLDTGDRDRKIEKQVRVTVTSCQKDASQKYYFVLDNGQVWKQNDKDRLRYRECTFGAVIMRDAFGYKMQIDGTTQHTRVTRIR